MKFSDYCEQLRNVVHIYLKRRRHNLSRRVSLADALRTVKPYS